MSEQEFDAAWAGAKNELIDSAQALLDLLGPKFLGPRGQITGISLESYKTAPPTSTDEYIRHELRENYESGVSFARVATIGLSFVKVGEIAQSARLAASKLPELYGAGIGGGQWVSFSEQWAASNPKTYITYVLKDAPESIRYVGRAKGVGTAEQVLAHRLRQGHHVFEANENLVAEVLAEHPTEEASMGAESVYHDYYQQKGHNLLNDPKSPPLSSKPSKLEQTRARIKAFFDSW